MSGLLKATILMIGVLLAAAAIVGMALGWMGRPSEPFGQTNQGTPERSERPAATPVDADSGTDPGVKTATFALG